MIPWGDWLAGVSYPGESCFGGFFIKSPGYDMYPGEIDSQGYDNPGSLTRQGMRPRGVRFLDLKFE